MTAAFNEDALLRVGNEFLPFLEKFVELGDQLKVARLAAGLEQLELAEKLGVTRQSIVWWETGVHYPRLPMLKKLESVLKTRFDFTGSGKNESSEIKPEYITLALSISRLSRANREAIIHLVNTLQIQAMTETKVSLEID